MANYHLEIRPISRKQGLSITKQANYITGLTLTDCHNGRTYDDKRTDVVFSHVFCPGNAPPEYTDIQTLCNEIDRAEKRRDARTAREFIGSLPNELELRDLIRIVQRFIIPNFTRYGLCAVAAIHDKPNVEHPSERNPHVHILVTTRAAGPDGFNRMKDREQDKRKQVRNWRDKWEKVQNDAYKEKGLPVRVSSRSLRSQGIEREPTRHLSLDDWRREQRGERTPAGDEKRAIAERNKERERKREIQREETENRELTR